MITNTNAALIQAERLLRRDAESLREAHTSHRDRDDWAGEDDAKAGYDEYIRAADALTALTTAAAVPATVVGEKFQRAWVQLDQLPGTMMVGPEGRFGPIPASTSAWITTSEEERDRCLSAGKPMLEMWLAAAPKAEPVPAAGAHIQQESAYTSVQLAEMVLSDCGHSSNYKPLLERVAGRIDRHVERLLTVQQADRAMRKQAAPACKECEGTGTVAGSQAHFACPQCKAAPAAVASPLTKLQRKAIAVFFTSDKVSVSEVQRKLSISCADAQTLCQSIVDLGLTDELELAPSLKRGAPAPHPAPVAQGDAEDAARYRWLRRKFCLTGNGDGTCHMHAINLPASIKGWPEPIEAEIMIFCDAAIDAARSQAKEGA